MADECPRECQVRLEHLEAGEKAADKVHDGLFSKINAANDNISKRVKTVTLLGLAAVIVIVLGGAFTLLYNQGTSIGTKVGVIGANVHKVEVQVVVVQEQLKAQKEDIEDLKERR